MGTRTRIKVCGITDAAEAEAIVSMGVDALGFIFVRSSPRFIEPEQARAIIAQLPPFVAAVGVFMDEEGGRVNEIATHCGLTMVQLHGSESPAFCRTMNRPVLKAFRIGAETLPDVEPYRGVRGVLLDTYRREMAGGTGAVFDWRLLEKLTLPGPLVLAGGLHPGNVAAAVGQLHPFAVDVNSGVEKSPGRKDLDLVRQLCAEVRQADSRK